MPVGLGVTLILAPTMAARPVNVFGPLVAVANAVTGERLLALVAASVVITLPAHIVAVTNPAAHLPIVAIWQNPKPLATIAV
jgi:hypothetical protein